MTSLSPPLILNMNPPLPRAPSSLASSSNRASQPDISAVSSIMRAYEEEKAVRMGLQQYLKNDVYEEMEKLKKEN